MEAALAAAGGNRTAFLAAALALAGCATLLPTTQSGVSSPWRSFDEARRAIEAIEPDRTTVADLKAARIDPYASQNVQLLSYSDVLLRFPLNAATSNSHLDRGLRTCSRRENRVHWYSISVREVKKDHVGSFWQDTLASSAWWKPRVAVQRAHHAGGRARRVHALRRAAPTSTSRKVSRQPLGPIQNLGDAVPVGRIGR